MILYIFIFIISCLMLFWAGKELVTALTRIAQFLNWREFVVAFFVMAFAASIPNLFVGISSALHGIPQLSFGDIVGGNVIDLTIAVALAAFVAKQIPAESRTVQITSLFTILIAILPLLLILDGILGRGDGIVLMGGFGLYSAWLFSKKERFTRVYDAQKISIVKSFRLFLKDIGKILLGIAFLLLSAEGIIMSASFFAKNLNLPLSLIGILLVGLGNAIPEIYFAIACAKAGDTWMILGNLMGAVIMPATLVLGIVALICPIKIIDFTPFAIGRFFLIISALFFLFFVRTDRKITKREAVFLLSIYILFVLCEVSLTR
ncbi:hypothetical protein AMJ50_02505 [Parcubacteria bacterium DG_74_3]|nr:MAG: hypothetical protein AMJ50_02505 [Parcubacteria bacterium DG_74_3]